MSDNENIFDKNKFVATEEDIKNIPKVSATASKLDIDITSTPPAVPPISGNDLSTDYQYIRTNLYSITERSIDALNNLVQIADQSQHPRAYEVVALLVNTIASAQKDLMTIHREKAKIENVIAKSQPEVVNNNLFVGNTAQLDEIIAKMTKKTNE